MGADTVYIILLDDKAYPRLNEWVKMEVGARPETIEFLNKLLYTFDNMKKGIRSIPGYKARINCFTETS